MEFEVLLALFTRMIDDRMAEVPAVAGRRGPRGITGAQGEPGKDFVFAEHEVELRSLARECALKFQDLSPEEIESLRGAQGREGQAGKSFDWELHKSDISQIILSEIQNLKPDLRLKFSDLSDDEKSELKGARGPRGIDGKAFDYEENRENIEHAIANAQLALVPDLKLKFSDLTEDERAELRGPRGQRGKPGETGAAGKDFVFDEHREYFDSLKPKFSDFTAEEKDGLKLKFHDLSDADKETLKLRFEHLSEDDRAEIRGPRGQRGRAGKDGVDGAPGKSIRGNPGPVGLTGAPGRDGVDGAPGIDGQDAPRIVDVRIVQRKSEWAIQFIFEDNTTITTNFVASPSSTTSFIYAGGVGVSGDASSAGNGVVGKDGASAYDIWIAQGNTGSKADFLNSLIGPKGATGNTGAKGDAGKSAYQTWLDLGNTGTEQDFINSLKASSGTGPDNQVLVNIPCAFDVYKNSVVRMSITDFHEGSIEDWAKLSDVLQMRSGTYTSVAVNALADAYAHCNIIGIVERKGSQTTCDIRIGGVTSDIFYGLDVTEEYFLSDTDPGKIVVTAQAPTSQGAVLLRVGQPISDSELLFQRGDRLVRGISS